MLNDRALGHPNTRGFYFVYFLCSTTEHLAIPTRGDLPLFTLCAQRPSTWPPQHKGIYFCLLFCAQRPSTWPTQQKGIYFCLLFVLNDRALGHPNTRGFYFCPLFDVFVLLSFPSSSITTTGEFDFLLTNYTKHKQNNRKRNTQICILFYVIFFLFSYI